MYDTKEMSWTFSNTWIGDRNDIIWPTNWLYYRVSVGKAFYIDQLLNKTTSTCRMLISRVIWQSCHMSYFYIPVSTIIYYTPCIQCLSGQYRNYPVCLYTTAGPFKAFQPNFSWSLDTVHRFAYKKLINHASFQEQIIYPTVYQQRGYTVSSCKYIS